MDFEGDLGHLKLERYKHTHTHEHHRYKCTRRSKNWLCLGIQMDFEGDPGHLKGINTHYRDLCVLINN